MNNSVDLLNIKCRDTKCGEDKHFYQPIATAMGSGAPCRGCHKDDINWNRVHKRKLSDIRYTVASLRTEYIRDVYWQAGIDETATNHARRKGLVKLKEDITKRLLKVLAPAELYWDGRQTPKQGNIIFYAQHATATCCRNCLAKWHKIPKGREMTKDEVAYCAALIAHYITQRMSNLTANGENIPPRRKPRLESQLADATAEENRTLTVTEQINSLDDALEAKRRRKRDD